MAQCSLQLVRDDDPDYFVMTQHPDNIRPQDLSISLGREYGDKQFKISLRRNIYVIYITRSETDPTSVSGSALCTLYRKNLSNTRNQDLPYNKRLEDTNQAETVLKKARLNRSRV